MPVQTQNLGTASLGYSFNGAVLIGATLVISSRNLVPPRLALYDLDTGRASDGPVVPSGSGAWALAAVGDVVFTAQSNARGGDVVFRHQLGSGEATPVARIDADYVWALVAGDDGSLYATDPGAILSIDPAQGTVRDLGLVDPAGQTVRALARSGGDLVWGGAGGGRPLLATAPIGGGPTRQVLPAALEGHALVYAVGTGPAGVAAGTQGAGSTRPGVAVLDAAFAPTGVAALGEEESTVDAVAVAEDAVYATARPSGALYRVGRDGGAERLGVPVAGAETRFLGVRGTAVIGVSAAERIWTWDIRTETLDVVDLLERGLTPGPEKVQSLSAGQGTVAAGGNFGLQVRDVGSGATRRWFVAGEPKDQLVVDGMRYLAVYPVGEVWAGPVALDAEPTRFARLPMAHNRPNTLAHDAATDLILCGSASAGGGALHLIARATGEVMTLADAIRPGEDVARVTAADGVAYLAGGAGSPTLVAYDLRARRELWRTPLGEGVSSVSGLAVLGGAVHALTQEGWHVAVDLASQAVRSSVRVSDSGGRLLATGQVLSGVDRDRLLELDPGPGPAPPVVLLDGLAQEVWGTPHLAADETGARYVLSGTDVLRVTEVAGAEP